MALPCNHIINHIRPSAERVKNSPKDRFIPRPRRHDRNDGTNTDTAIDIDPVAIVIEPGRLGKQIKGNEQQDCREQHDGFFAGE